MKNGKIGWGIIGCGNISGYHARGVAANPGLAEIVAFCDIEEQKAQKLCKEYNVKQYYKDFNEMLKNKDIDAVSVCTPSGLHMEVTLAAAKAKKHILCEKPLDVTLDKIDRMIEAARKADVRFGGVFQRRTFPESKLLKKAVEDGTLGKMILGDAYLKYTRSDAYYKSAGWRATWELDGGGALMNQGIHGIDLISWIMGGISSVYAKCGTKVRKIPVEDTALALVTFKSGAWGVIEGTTSIWPGLETKFEVSGTKGTIILEEAKILKWEVEGEKDKASEMASARVKTTGGAHSDPKAIEFSGHIAHVKDMVEAIKAGRDPMVNGEEGRKAVQIILAIYESSKKGKEISIKD
ncbi:MAG: oxidoreductase [Candidatus Firestonebacteria bacterium RIFOXYC2_FULL_39_67]|nr:MAG: oxidoreductase [Candidatus Firestonebacteria bacterium RIFOXYD2_FULL_39_29]OGF56735.1 MAG: oxidoreductase [Candidatus Firestonebacteria bacterium RIFOXYC2_FULL_39_67]OGF57627.1 MAG: oxidoreductase [Candidatus Firestonebacteria bacterium RifOxyC12_full_39_7]